MDAALTVIKCLIYYAVLKRGALNLEQLAKLLYGLSLKTMIVKNYYHLGVAVDTRAAAALHAFTAPAARSLASPAATKRA